MATTPRSSWRIPGAVRRLGRDRSRVIALVLLVIVTLTASGVQSAAASILQHTLDANWRGAYDILVTAKNNPAPTDGVLPPNSLGAGDRGMSLADVTKIRQVAGVDVAAPIGEIDVAQLRWANASVALPESAVNAHEVPQAFALSASFTTDDGLGPRYVSDITATVVVDQTPKPPATPPQPCTFNETPVDVTKYPLLCGRYDPYQSEVTTQQGNGYGSGGTSLDGVIYFELSPVPQGSTRVTLIDPAAEMKLLGSHGDFLRPLRRVNADHSTSIDDMNSWAESADDRYAKAFRDQQAAAAAQESTFGDGSEYRRQYEAFRQENGLTDDMMAPGPSPVYVPLIAAQGGSAPLNLTATVRSLGPAPRTPDPLADFPYAVDKGTGTLVGSSTVDASALLNPFATRPVDLPWPGTQPAPRSSVETFTTLSLGSVGTISGVQYRKAAAGSLVTGEFALPVDTSGSGAFQTARGGFRPGAESVYSPVTPLPQRSDAGGNVGVPVGSFSPDDLLGLQSDLSYVPLGAYQTVDSTVMHNGTPVTMQPSVTGLGLVNPRTVAIASIESAPAWNQKLPVSAVRIRVAGIAGYTPQSREKVAAVAAKIHALGFTATMVAGSSPRAVDITVDGYAFGVTDRTEQQKVGRLGTVSQNWSELGAVARADTAVSAASIAALGISVGAAALLFGAVQFVSIPRRREEAGALRMTGWSSARIRRWMVAEDVPGLGALLLAGVVTVVMSGFASIPIVVAGTTTALVVMTSLGAVWLGSRTVTRPPRVRAARASVARSSARYSVTSPMRFGMRQVRSHPLISVVQGLSLVIVALASAVLADLIVRGRQRAGVSLLAQFVSTQAAIAQLILALVSIVAGVALTLLVRRIVVARRREQSAVLRSMGWTSRDLRTAGVSELSLVAIPALLVATELASVGAGISGAPDRGVLVAAAALSIAAVALVLAAVPLPARYSVTRVLSSRFSPARFAPPRRNGSRP